MLTTYKICFGVNIEKSKSIGAAVQRPFAFAFSFLEMEADSMETRPYAARDLINSFMIDGCNRSTPIYLDRIKNTNCEIIKKPPITVVMDVQ